MPYYILKCYLLLKLASHLVRTWTTMEISSTPIAFVLSLSLNKVKSNEVKLNNIVINFLLICV